MSFSLTSFIQIAIKDVLFPKSDEKKRAFLTELFFVDNFNTDDLHSDEKISNIELLDNKNNFKIAFKRNSISYKMDVDFTAKNMFLFRIFRHTIFVPFFVNQKISIYNNKNVLIYKDGSVVYNLTETQKIGLHNEMFYLSFDLAQTSKNLDENNESYFI